LGAGRRDLDDHIRRLERSLAQADADATASADSVLSRIRQGLSWSIVPGKPVPDYSKELQIARTALAKLDSERAAKEAQLEAIGARVASAGKRVHNYRCGILRCKPLRGIS
jgi:multidrug resistance efflux pump